MPVCDIGSLLHASRPFLPVIALALWSSMASGQPTEFLEEFDGPSLDAAWSQLGDPAGHPASIAGSYEITDAHGSPGTAINRPTGGTVSSFTHEVELVFDAHLLGGSGGTLSDIKFRSIGADGILDVVYNSFGHLRVNHTDFNTGNGDHIVGGSPDNIEIGYADGDLLKLMVEYNNGTDTIDVSYAINDEAPTSVYSGSGIDGQFGDVITSSVELLVFKFGDAVPDQTMVAIDSWSLAEAVAGSPADFNGDDSVNGIDFLEWQRDPDLGDLAIWQGNYGSQTLAATSVPEPTGMLLLLLFTTATGLSRSMLRY